MSDLESMVLHPDVQKCEKHVESNFQLRTYIYLVIRQSPLPEMRNVPLLNE
jgi:hypothetical protein